MTAGSEPGTGLTGARDARIHTFDDRHGSFVESWQEELQRVAVRGLRRLQSLQLESSSSHHRDIGLPTRMEILIGACSMSNWGVHQLGVRQTWRIVSIKGFADW